MERRKRIQGNKTSGGDFTANSSYDYVDGRRRMLWLGQLSCPVRHHSAVRLEGILCRLATNRLSIRRAFPSSSYPAASFVSFVPWAHPRLPADVLTQSNSDQIFSADRANVLSDSSIAGLCFPANKSLTLRFLKFQRIDEFQTSRELFGKKE